jgi:hypothetical protein
MVAEARGPDRDPADGIEVARRRSSVRGLKRLAGKGNLERSAPLGRPASLDPAPPPAAAQLRRLRNEVAFVFALKVAALFALYLLFFARGGAPTPTFDALDAPPGQSSPRG